MIVYWLLNIIAVCLFVLAFYESVLATVLSIFACFAAAVCGYLKLIQKPIINEEID